MERETLRKDNAKLKFTNFSQEVVIKQCKEQTVKLDQELVQLRTYVRNLKKKEESNREKEPFANYKIPFNEKVIRKREQDI